MPPRQYSKSKSISKKYSLQITLPIDKDAYATIIDDAKVFRDYLDVMIDLHPELFPPDIQSGYHLHGLSALSKKMPEIRTRRMKLKQVTPDGQAQVMTILPSFILPYRAGYTDAVEKGLFLYGMGVPYWALTYVFGKNDQYWYRLVVRLGHHDLVGTTLKSGDQLPDHVLADEKHTWFNGDKAYIATTVSNDCVFGASITLKADTPHLTEAYSHFKQEARRLKPDYQPITVNTDGWGSTIKAWLALFPRIVIIRCFLHAFIAIRSCCKRLHEFPQLCDRVWAIYRADSQLGFYREVAELYAWAQDRFQGTAKTAIHKLCAKTGDFLLAFDHPDAYRTSNMIDRLMVPMDRYLHSSRYFHGHLMSAEYQIRAWALIYNFHPYCPRAKIRKTYRSPAHQLNGFVYHDNWLHNLLVSTSCQRFYVSHKIR